jgi:glycosyltransferase involved in cell wall biosynthesis
VNDEKARLFGAADWLVLSYNESFASTTSMLWEACAYGVPVIASSGNELERLVRQWNLGLIFQAGDEGDLAWHIDAARSAALRDSFSANCDDFLGFFSEEAWLKGTADLLGSPSAADSTPSRTPVTSRTSA